MALMCGQQVCCVDLPTDFLPTMGTCYVTPSPAVQRCLASLIQLFSDAVAAALWCF